MLAVMVDELVMPRTVRTPALVVMDPMATSDVLAVIVDELVMPLMVRTPALAVTEP